MQHLLQQLSDMQVDGAEAVGPQQTSEARRTRQEELDRLLRLDEAQRILDDDAPYLLISYNWLVRWRQYVKANGQRPGPITNNELVEADGVTLRPGLLERKDYKLLYRAAYEEFLLLYGNLGPTLERATPDIYAVTLSANSMTS